jgi:hypothetical protein
LSPLAPGTAQRFLEAVAGAELADAAGSGALFDVSKGSMLAMRTLGCVCATTHTPLKTLAQARASGALEGRAPGTRC